MKWSSNNNPFNKFKALHKSDKSLYFELDKIEDVVNCIFELNQAVFSSKVYPSIVTNIQNKDNVCKVVGSMMVDELFVRQFDDYKSDFPFIEEFMQAQMLVSFREQACRERTDEEEKKISHKL